MDPLCTMRTVFIYGLADPDSHEIRYIGKTADLAKRLISHCQEAKNESGTHRLHWIAGLLREGRKPAIRVLEECVETAWVEREKYWIAYYRSLGARLTNSTDGGEGTCNPSPETLAKISASMSIAKKGKKHSPEHTAKLAEHLRVCNIGRKHTDETKAKVAAGSRSWKRTSAHMKKMQAARHAQPNSDETRAKIGDKQAYEYIVTSADGVETRIRNLNEFIRQNGLHESSARRVVDGVFKQTKGWRIRRV